MDARSELFGGLELFFQRLFGLAESEGLSFLVDVELSLTQVRISMLLSCSDALPIGSVADHLGLSVHAVGRSVDQLVDLGVVERRECAQDRRVRMVSLSPRGLEIIDQHLASRRRALQTFIERLAEEQVRAFLGVLDPILAGDYLRPRPTSDPVESRGGSRRVEPDPLVPGRPREPHSTLSN